MGKTASTKRVGTEMGKNAATLLEISSSLLRLAQNAPDGKERNATIEAAIVLTDVAGFSAQVCLECAISDAEGNFAQINGTRSTDKIVIMRHLPVIPAESAECGVVPQYRIQAALSL